MVFINRLLFIYFLFPSPLNNDNAKNPYGSLDSSSQSGTPGEFLAFGERKIEESSDVTDRSSSSSDCKISCADKLGVRLAGV